MDEVKIGVEIELKTPDSFLVVKETLTRIGIQSKTGKTLYQSCHILHKRGQYYITSFKEMFLLDHKTADITDDDYRRRNSIVKLLAQWGLCNIIDKNDIEFLNDNTEIKIVPFKDKKNWSLIAKYTIGGHGKKRIRDN